MNNAEGTKFFIMLPVDKWGNTRYGNPSQGVIEIGDTPTYPVIEAIVQKGEPWMGDRLTVVAPDDFAASWPTISGRIGTTFGVSYMEVEGPARIIESNEWASLVFGSGDDQLKEIVSSRIKGAL